jgi:hypothetical protein
MHPYGSPHVYFCTFTSQLVHGTFAIHVSTLITFVRKLWVGFFALLVDQPGTQ